MAALLPTDIRGLARSAPVFREIAVCTLLFTLIMATGTTAQSVRKSKNLQLRCINSHTETIGTSTCMASINLIFHNQSGRLCHVYPEDGWNRAAADVACHQKCFDGAANVSYNTTSLLELAQTNERVWLASFSCHGSESYLDDCQDYQISSLHFSPDVLRKYHCRLPIVSCFNKTYSSCMRQSSWINIYILALLITASCLVLFVLVFAAVLWTWKRWKRRKRLPRCQVAQENRRPSPAHGEDGGERTVRNRGTPRNGLTSLHEPNSTNTSVNTLETANTHETSLGANNGHTSDQPLPNGHNRRLANGRLQTAVVVTSTRQSPAKPCVHYSTASVSSADLLQSAV